MILHRTSRDRPILGDQVWSTEGPGTPGLESNDSENRGMGQGSRNSFFFTPNTDVLSEHRVLSWLLDQVPTFLDRRWFPTSTVSVDLIEIGPLSKRFPTNDLYSSDCGLLALLSRLCSFDMSTTHLYPRGGHTIYRFWGHPSLRGAPRSAGLRSLLLLRSPSPILPF